MRDPHFSNIDILVNPKFGLIQRVMKVPEYPSKTMPEVKVYVATGSQNKIQGFSASGAGITDQSAKISAIGEYVERYCALMPDFARTMSTSDLDGFGIPTLNTAILKEMKSESLQSLDWVIGEDLLSGKATAVPCQMAYLSLAKNPGERNHFITTATGAACGQSKKDAIYRGLAECFERDAIQIMWRNQIQMPHIDFMANHDMRVFYHRYIECQSVKYSLFRLVMDYDVPAVFGLAEIKNGGVVAAASVRGTWVEACKKTLIELCQSLVGYGPLIQSDEYVEYKDDFSDMHTYDDHTFMYLNPRMRTHLDFLLGNEEIIPMPQDRAGLNEISAYTEQFLAELESINATPIAVDITTPDIKEFGWSVVKIIVPGFADLEPGTKMLFDYKRVKEVPGKLLNMSKRLAEQIGGSATAPHPFP